MKNKSELIADIALEILEAEDLQEYQWNSLSLVCDVRDDYFGQNGFLYNEEEVIPFVAVTSDTNKLPDLCLELKEYIEKESDLRTEKMLMLIQINDEDKLKVEFEFENMTRWSVTPANLKKIREELRPDFSE